MSVGALVAVAVRLPCRYPGDPCDGWFTRHRNREAVKDFERCDCCRLRDLAKAVELTLPRVPSR